MEKIRIIYKISHYQKIQKKGREFMKRVIALLLLVVFIITSCGPNVEHKEDTDTDKSEKSKDAQSVSKDEKKDDNKQKNQKTEEDNYNYEEIVSRPIKLEITKEHRPFKMLQNRGELLSIPKYDSSDNSSFQVDFRGYDLRKLEITKENLSDVRQGSFNTFTQWPENLPEEFNPEEIMEIGKNPGLNIRELHKQGITGKGVGLAIIDQSLLVGHIEYKDQLRFYEEIHYDGYKASMHGAAVASIAVGKTVGVAPDAKLYYIAETHGEYFSNGFEWDFTWLAMSIDRILELNKTLPEDEKIKVISISVGWSSKQQGYQEMVEAINRAKEQGIFIVSSSLYNTYGFYFHGLGREWYDDPDDYTTYLPGNWWEDNFWNKEAPEMLLVPMAGITTASPTGNEEYVYYPQGGWSWSIPYIAGLYALACQVKSDVTPEEFWEVALATGDSVELEKDGKIKTLSTIVNPIKLIEKLQEKNQK